jgi:hypothetical protein
MSETSNDSRTLLEQRVRLGHGFTSGDRPRVLEALAGAARHLAGWQPEQVELEISVKDREGPEQKVTLEAWLVGWPHFVATSTAADLDRALAEVRKDLVRQLEVEKTKRDPRRASSPHKGRDRS